MPKLPKYLPKDGRFLWMIPNNQLYYDYEKSTIYIRNRLMNDYDWKCRCLGRAIQVRFVPHESYDAVVAIDNQMPIDREISKQTIINLPPRIRMCMLYAISQSRNGRVANTCNLSEDWVGWNTRYGDSVGDFAPLASLTKTEVKEIGKVLGLPNKLVNKTPIDGLCGKTDEESFGFSYEVLDKYIRTGEIKDMDIKEKIDTMHEKNLFKLQLMSSFEL